MHAHSRQHEFCRIAYCLTSSGAQLAKSCPRPSRFWLLARHNSRFKVIEWTHSPGALRRTWINLPLRGKGSPSSMFQSSLPRLGSRCFFRHVAARGSGAAMGPAHHRGARELNASCATCEAESTARGFVISHSGDFLPRLDARQAHAEKQIEELSRR